MISPLGHLSPVEDAQQMIYPTRKKTLKTFTWGPEEICDFGFNLPDGKPGSSPTIPQPLNFRLVVPCSPQIPSPHYRQRLKKTSFMFCKARAPTGNERVLAWKTNKENEGEKLTVERGIHSSSPVATGLRLHGETNFWLLLCACVCIIAAGAEWNSPASISGDVFFPCPTLSTYKCCHPS